MKQTFKILLRVIVAGLAMAAFVLLLRRANTLLMPKSPHGINQMRYYYEQPKDTIDVLFVGSSHVHCSINTAYLWSEYGIPSYDLSGAEQPLWMTDYILRDALKTQSPKAVVLECYSAIAYHDEYHYKWISENILGMRLSMNKLKMLNVSVEPWMMKEYFPGFSTWHSRYGELNETDYAELKKTQKDIRGFKGFTPYFNTEPMEKPEFGETWSGNLSAKSEEYLNDIIELCADKEIPLFLIVSPYVVQSEEELRTAKRLDELAGMMELPFYNFTWDEAIEKMGLDYATDFNDYSHLNYAGTKKYANYLGELLKFLCDLPDRQEENEDGRYNSWDVNVMQIYDMAKEAGFEQ